MLSITKTFETATAHRILGHKGKCAHLHGHTYKWEVTIVLGVGMSTDVMGMVVDFGDVKATVGAWLDEVFDHAVVLQHDDPLVPAILSADPDAKVTLLDGAATSEIFARFAFDKVNELLEGSLICTKVRCWETPTSFADCSK